MERGGNTVMLVLQGKVLTPSKRDSDLVSVAGEFLLCSNSVVGINLSLLDLCDLILVKGSRTGGGGAEITCNLCSKGCEYQKCHAKRPAALWGEDS